MKPSFPAPCSIITIENNKVIQIERWCKIGEESVRFLILYQDKQGYVCSSGRDKHQITRMSKELKTAVSALAEFLQNCFIEAFKLDDPDQEKIDEIFTFPKYQIIYKE
ncbi:hypothetical protein HOB10_00300 [Candidatus Parcubacteria bacterium]|jgi:hypothetical protein|nr:hypothetical protein [Candidatus Parcubacteria bacterium]